MGKLEKLVVLTVLFAAAVVLAISFNKGVGTVDAADPLSGAEKLLDPAPGVPRTAALDPVPESQPAGEKEDNGGMSLLLNAGSGAGSRAAPAGGEAATAEEASALSTEPESDPNRPILVDTHGLRPSFLDQYMTYEVTEGDTWAGLAQRFYQDGRYTRNLHLVNEDLRELTPGKQILVPVYDFLAVDAGLQAGMGGAGLSPSKPRPGSPATGSAPEPVAEAPAAKAPEGKGAAKAAKEDTARPAGIYEVRSGDTLSDISKAVFGTATRWKEILEANRDKLKKPESLQVGMKLTIPGGGKVPKGGARAAKASASQSPSAPKKRVD